MDTESPGKVDVPYHFLCPISLQLMRDPVIVPTGITYDRENIEKWLFFFNKATCPVTRQPLSAGSNSNLTPNHTLWRFIQSWCTTNSYTAIEWIPAPKLTTVVDEAYVHKLINEAKSNPNLVASCIGRLRMICSVNKRNLKCLEQAGGVEFIVSVIVSCGVNTNSTVIGSKFIKGDSPVNSTLASLDDDALFLIHGMDLDAATYKNIANNNVKFIHSLAEVMKPGTHSSQAGVLSISILRSLFQAADPNRVINVPGELFVSIVQILSDNISVQATKNAMKLLVEICPWGRNRIKAVEAKAVSTIINILLKSLEKRITEISLLVLDQLCGCAEVRSELLNHDKGLAVVGRKLLTVSHGASDKAVRVLSLVSKHSANPMVLQNMLKVGVVEKMLLILQTDCSTKMKERCRDMLRLHARAWRTSPCIPSQLLSYYPSPKLAEAGISKFTKNECG